jgi:Fic family protein
MIDGELMKMRDMVKEKITPLEFSEEFLIDLVFNTLSFDAFLDDRDEVVKVFKGETEGITPDKVQLINNQKNAFLFILKMVKENIPMDENRLKDLHQIIMAGFSDIGGLYRNVDISVKGSNHTPPSHIKVYDRMKKYFEYTLSEPNENNLFEYIAYCHLQLAKIHPFLDGNGRASRCVLNYQLMRFGFMPVIIKREDFNNYFDCLETFKVNKNIIPFVRFLEDLEKEALTRI